MSDLPQDFVRPDRIDWPVPDWLWPDAPRSGEVIARLNWLEQNGQPLAPIGITGVNDMTMIEVAGVCERVQFEAELYDAHKDHAVVVIAGEAPPEVLHQLRTLDGRDRVIVWRHTGLRLDPPGAAHVQNANELIEAIAAHIDPVIRLEPRCEALSVRSYRVDDEHWMVIFNNGDDPIDVAATFSIGGERSGIDPETGDAFALGQRVRLMLPPRKLAMLRIESA